MYKKFVSSSDKFNVLNYVNEKLKPKYPAKSVKDATQNPRTLNRLTIINNQFNPLDHFVSKKVDGKTSLVMIVGDYLFGIIDGQHPIILKEPIKGKIPFADQILEGEYIEEKNAIILHDIPTMAEDYDKIVKELNSYLPSLNKIQKKLTFSTKNIKQVKSVDDIEEMYKENPDYETDGLIFTNKIVKGNPIYKWKPREQLTIDLICVEVENQKNRCILLSCKG